MHPFGGGEWRVACASGPAIGLIAPRHPGGKDTPMAAVMQSQLLRRVSLCSNAPASQLKLQQEAKPESLQEK